MGKKITRIKLAGFKSIKKMDLKLGNINLLIGANGAGKSNLIDFFNFTKHITSGNLGLYTSSEGGADYLLHFGSQITKKIECELFFDQISYSFNLSPSKDDFFVFTEEDIKDEGKSILAQHLTQQMKLDDFAISGYLETILKQKKDSTLEKILSDFRDWKIYHFDQTGKGLPIRKNSVIANTISLSKDASNLASMLYLFKTGGTSLIESYPKEKDFFQEDISDIYERSYENIVKFVKRVAPFFQDFVLEPSPGNSDFVKIRWRQEGKNITFDANSLSDGTLRFICLATLLLQPNLPSVIIIDEPELGLHPFAIHLLAGLIESVSKNSQIIISTQSPALASCFAPEDIIVVDYHNNASVFNRLKSNDLKEWLEEFDIGQIWEKNIIGGNPA